MATGLISDFKIYHDEFQTGLIEKTAQNIDIFNERSNGCILLEAKSILGDYEKRALTTLIASLVSRRDNTSVAAATSLKPAQDEFIGVKLDRKIGPIDYTHAALSRIQMSAEAYSVALGEMVGAAIVESMVKAVIKALVAAMTGNAAMVYDVSTTEYLTSVNMINAKALFGDRSSALGCWVFHGTPFHKLMLNQVAEGLDSVSGMILGRGGIATQGLPYIVTDDASLVNSAKYYNLCLQPGAARVSESEAQKFVTEWVTGLEQLVYRVQGELSFNVDLLGFKWDTANGGANPADATLATTTNWDQVATSDKDTCGVVDYTL